MNLLLYLIFGAIIIGILLYIFPICNPVVISISQLSICLAAIHLFITVRVQGILYLSIGNWPFGKGVSLYVDHLSSALILLTSCLFILLFIYEWEHISGQPLFMFLLFVLQGLLFALFVSHDLFNIFVLMEVSTMLVTILIVFLKNPTAYYDGLIYLLTNILGMSFFLLGIGYIYKLYGVFDLTLLKIAVAQGGSSPSMIMAYALLMTGISFKVGVLPVFIWLPRAHVSLGAPSVVSAAISGIYINVGFLFFMKLQDIFTPLVPTAPLFFYLGLLTSVAGSLLALAQNDIKRLLAYSTVSQLGFILIGLTLPHDAAYYGSIYHIFSHSVFKVLLFLISGILAEQYGTRNILQIKGVLRRMPLLGVCTIAGILGITGAPFFNGSIGKYMISKSTNSALFEWTLYLITFLTILYLSKFAMILFGNHPRKEISRTKNTALLILATLCIIGGLQAPVFMDILFGYSVHIDALSYSLKSILYILSVLIGFVLYRKKIQHSRILKAIREIDIPFNLVAFMLVFLFITILSASWFIAS